MIDLNEQILSFLFSLLYGVVCSMMYLLSYKFLYYSKKIYCFFNSFLFCNLLVIIYFKILYLINDGVYNIYFIITVIVSFLISCKIFTKKMSK